VSCVVLGGIVLYANRKKVVQVAGTDPLRDEGIAFAEALKAAGVDVELKAYGGLPHCFTMFTAFPQTAEYYDRVIAFVKKHAGDKNSRL
jgi:acetyl esterase/lipase